MQEALCYSKTKRSILSEKETSRIPVKIAHFAKTLDGTKLVINDITSLTAPNDLEYSFQFSEQPEEQSFVQLHQLSSNETPEDKITVCCKVLNVGATKVVGQAKYTVANITIADVTGQIVLDVWNNLIPHIKENKVYKFTNLSVRFWNGNRKLATTSQTVISETLNQVLQELQVDDAISPTDLEITVSSIDTIEHIVKYKVCANCGKRILQVQDKVVNCDHCNHKMRSSRCKTKISVSLVVTKETNKLYLTMLDDSLKEVIGTYDPDEIETTAITEKLLFLENIKITYTESNKVVSITPNN